MSKDENSKNILVIVTGLLVLAFIFKGGEEFPNKWLIIAATLIGLVSLVSNRLGNLIVKLWFKIGHVLGWINTRILLTIVFYLFLFPMSLIYKLSGKDSLNKKNPKDTVFQTRDHLYTKDDLKNAW